MVSNKEKNFASAVVYVNNNENQIEDFLNNIYNVFQETFEKFEIICVNDCSEDNSVEKIKQVSSKFTKSVVSIINMSFYQGVESSMNAGVNLAIGDFVYEFDSVNKDYDDKLITHIYYQALKGFDIVSTTPKKNRKFSSRLFYKVFNRVFKSSYKLNTESFRILSRRAINRVHAMSKTIPYRKALYSNCGLKLYNIVYENNIEINTNYSKESGNNRKAMAIDSLIIFTDIAYKMTSIMAGVMMLSTIFMAIYSLVIFFTKANMVEGWTTIMLFLSLSFFGIFAILAIIIKYLSLIVNLIFKKQLYIIESIEKVTQ